MTKARILQDAIATRPTGRLTKQDVAALAAEGLLADVATIETTFRSWGEFQALFRQLRQQLK